MISEVVWGIGGYPTDMAIIDAYYSFVYMNGSYSYNNNPVKWTGYVSLMHPSDYGYATSGGSTQDRTSCVKHYLSDWHNYSYKDCPGNDWLNNNSLQWTMMPISKNSDNAIYLNSG